LHALAFRREKGGDPSAPKCCIGRPPIAGTRSRWSTWLGYGRTTATPPVGPRFAGFGLTGDGEPARDWISPTTAALYHRTRCNGQSGSRGMLGGHSEGTVGADP
jgi:hypothetical protein